MNAWLAVAAVFAVLFALYAAGAWTCDELARRYRTQVDIGAMRRARRTRR